MRRPLPAAPPTVCAARPIVYNACTSFCGGERHARLGSRRDASRRSGATAISPIATTIRQAAARAWTDAEFDDETTAGWLEARCFDPASARELADLGVTPGQASKRTRDGAGESYIDTIAYKVSMGQLSARQGAARAASSR